MHPVIHELCSYIFYFVRCHRQVKHIYLLKLNKISKLYILTLCSCYLCQVTFFLALSCRRMARFALWLLRNGPGTLHFHWLFPTLSSPRILLWTGNNSQGLLVLKHFLWSLQNCSVGAVSSNSQIEYISWVVSRMAFL